MCGVRTCFRILCSLFCVSLASPPSGCCQWQAQLPQSPHIAVGTATANNTRNKFHDHCYPRCCWSVLFCILILLGKTSQAILKNPQSGRSYHNVAGTYKCSHVLACTLGGCAPPNPPDILKAKCQTLNSSSLLIVVRQFGRQTPNPAWKAITMLQPHLTFGIRSGAILVAHTL